MANIADSSLKVKYSRFRHIYAKSVRRSEWYDTGPGHALAVAANPKMIAIAVDVPAGGLVQVARMLQMGRGHMIVGKIKEHQGVVCDLKWDPFNDNVLATASNDSTVRIWHIDDNLRISYGTVQLSSIYDYDFECFRCLRTSKIHGRRVHMIEWHSVIDNAILSASFDGRIAMWNVETDQFLYIVEDCFSYSFALSLDGSEFAVTTKSRELIIFDARNGEKLREGELVHDGIMLTRVCYFESSSKVKLLLTTGNCRSARRQLAVYDPRELIEPLAIVDVDSGSGLLTPVLDNDLSLLYLTGKGDTNIRFYEVQDVPPYLTYLNESTSHKAHTTICALPKRGLDVSKCEIMRIFRVDAEQLVIEPLSFIVPRKADGFQADLYPPTRSPTPALTFREWLAGLNEQPILIELRNCTLNCTYKPVIFLYDSSKNVSKLITTDVNNDRKFKFLSQVTKPDYRKITDREDFEELSKLEEIRSRVAASYVDEGNSPDCGVRDCCNKIKLGNDENIPSGAKIPFKNEIGSEILCVENDVEKANSETVAALSPKSRGSVFSSSSCNIVEPGQLHSSKWLVKAVPHSIRDVKKSKHNGRVEKGVQNLTHQPNTIRKCNSLSHEAFDNVVMEFDKELSNCRSHCEKLEKIICSQQADIDSLRYEIKWKDERIIYLLAQLNSTGDSNAGTAKL